MGSVFDTTNSQMLAAEDEHNTVDMVVRPVELVTNTVAVLLMHSFVKHIDAANERTIRI